MRCVRRNLEKTFASGHVQGYIVEPDGVYPDIGDAHVHYATAHTHADILSTNDTNGFAEPGEMPYEIYNCDDFLTLVDDSAAHIVRTVIVEQLRHFHRKGVKTSLPKRLNEAAAPNLAERVRVHLQSIDIGRALTSPADLNSPEARSAAQ